MLLISQSVRNLSEGNQIVSQAISFINNSQIMEVFANARILFRVLFLVYYFVSLSYRLGLYEDYYHLFNKTFFEMNVINYSADIFFLLDAIATINFRKFLSHRTVAAVHPYSVELTVSGNGSGISERHSFVCSNCEEPATLRCTQCGDVFLCDSCDFYFHTAKKLLHSHKRHQVSQYIKRDAEELKSVFSTTVLVSVCKQMGSPVFEILCLFPFELVAYSLSYDHCALLRLTKLLRVLKIAHYWNDFSELLRIKNIIISPSGLRALLFICVHIVVAHVAACMYFRLAVKELRRGNEKNWLIHDGDAYFNTTTGDVLFTKTKDILYLRAVYFAVQTLVTFEYSIYCSTAI